ncbi:MAG: glycerol-3-phosphate acyltransferase [Candidatus Hermodarchaeota archaeon]
MDIMIIIIAGLIGYLIGSLSFSRIISRIVAPNKALENLKFEIKGKNFQETVPILTGYGAERASMVLGARWGLMIGILDMLKVIVPMVVFKAFLYPQENYHLVIAITGLIGHNWPIYYRFKGGRGLSVILGSYFVIDWLGAILTPVFGFALGLFLIGDVMIAYPMGYWLMIPWFLFRTNDLAFFIYAILSNIIFLIATIPEIREDLQMRREGKYKEYREALLKTSARARGMKKWKIKSWD